MLAPKPKPGRAFFSKNERGMTMLKSKWFVRCFGVLLMAAAFFVGALAQQQGKVFTRASVIQSLSGIANKCAKAGMAEEYKLVMKAVHDVATLPTEK